MVSFQRKNRKLGKSDYPGGSYITETSPSADPPGDQPAEPDMGPDSSFLDEPATGRPETSRAKTNKNFILTGRNALVLGGLGLLIAAWAFLVGLFIGLGFLLEDKAFVRMRAILSTKLSSEKNDVGAIPAVEKEIVSLFNGQPQDAQPKSPPPEPATPPPTPKPPAAPKAPSSGTDTKFAVQVAATYTESDAQKLVDDLEKKGYKAYFFKATVDGRNYYRVRVGRFDTMAEAKDVMKKLDGQGFEGMFIWRLKDES